MQLPETREEFTVWKLAHNLSENRTLLSRSNRGKIAVSVREIILWSRRIEEKFPDLVHYENYNVFRNEYTQFIAGVSIRVVMKDFR